MPPRFDDDTLTLRLSVADLLERDALRRIGFAQRGGFERLWLGQAIHAQYQERALGRDGSYQREVTLTARFAHRGWTVELFGRLDGLRRDPDGVLCVEEIKSVRADAPPSPAALELYRRQALAYAWMIEQERDEPARAELVLIEIGGQDEAIERLALDADRDALEAGIRRRLNGLLREHESQRGAADSRREAAQRLRFPFHRPRQGQELILAGVERALEQREHLLVEAATGIGKTVAALYPVVRYALANDRRVYVLTAKTLQQAMATRVLDLLNPERSFNALQLRAKSRMCANGEVICHEDYCDYARDFFVKLGRDQLVPRLLDEHPTLHPDAVYRAGSDHGLCPFELSLELAGQSQVVVGDYNYAFDPYVALSDFSEDNDLSHTILVVDEIHNLIDRGRGYYSPLLSSARAREVTAAIASGGSGAIAERLARLSQRLAVTIEDAVSEALGAETRNAMVEGGPPEDSLWELRPELDRAFVDYLEHRRETRSFRAEDPFVGLYFDVLRFQNTLLLSRARSDAFSHLLEVANGDRRLRILCKDASRYLGRVINRCHSVVGLSATLRPHEFFRDLLGFDPERTASISIPNPFPREHKVVVVDSTVQTSFRYRDENYDRIALQLAELAAAVPGNCLALFPSYSFLSEVAGRLPPSHGKRLLIQDRADGERERQQILDTLASALFGDVLLLAVAGGVFAEGVDYPGDMLKAVAIVGPCLPTVSLEQKLLEAYYQERFERGFEYAFVVPGMTRVVQAAGRLIRSSSDRGVIALLDRRFLSDLYQRHVPPDWQDEGGKLRAGRPAAVAAAFFAAVPGERGPERLAEAAVDDPTMRPSRP